MNFFHMICCEIFLSRFSDQFAFHTKYRKKVTMDFSDKDNIAKLKHRVRVDLKY